MIVCLQFPNVLEVPQKKDASGAECCGLKDDDSHHSTTDCDLLDDGYDGSAFDEFSAKSFKNQLKTMLVAFQVNTSRMDALSESGQTFMSQEDKTPA